MYVVMHYWLVGLHLAALRALPAKPCTLYTDNTTSLPRVCCAADKEFKMIWLRVADVRGELLKRGVQVSKWANPWKLMKLLDRKLDEEVEKVVASALAASCVVLRPADGVPLDASCVSTQGRILITCEVKCVLRRMTRTLVVD